MQYVIVGNGTAATSAIEAIRESDRENKITVVSDESYINYSRPLIPYFLAKKVDLEKMAFRPQKFYQTHKVNLILNQQAAKLDTNKKTVVLAAGGKISFDRLLIATGGSPIIPEIKGVDLEGVFTFTKLSDTQRMEKYIQDEKVKQTVVLGAGLIGLKATEALSALKIKVTIIELADRILSGTFDQKASRIIERALKRIGCNLITKNTVLEIKAEKRQLKEAVLKDRTRIHTDMVVVAIGVRPNIELAKDTPIKTNKGILVDKFMQTNIEGIYAAGDCTEQSLAIWPAAAREGKVAGYNMTGEKRACPRSFAMNSVELCGIPTISVGQTIPDKGCRVVEHFAQDRAIYKKLVLRDERIVGTIFVGDIERAGIYTGLIKDGMDVRSFKHSLLKEDFGLVSLPREYRKHLVEAEAAII